MLGFLASGGEEFYLGPVTRLDCSELLCNKVLLKYKREKASDIDTRRGAEKVPPCQSLAGCYIATSSLLEKAVATHSSTLAWKIPWTGEPGRLQSMGSLGVGHD